MVIINATCNWWGDTSGPSGNVNDPVTSTLANGSGDAVSENVNFDPWLGKKFIELIKDDFKNEKAWSGQQKALLAKMEAVSKQIKNGAYQGAINKLQNDILNKIEKWIDEPPREDLIEEVEAIIEILEGLLK
jgi:hypothetical protein